MEFKISEVARGLMKELYLAENDEAKDLMGDEVEAKEI